MIFDLSKKRLDQLESKSIQNSSLLRFRTLFYPDKLSLDILKDLLFHKQKKNYSMHVRGCLNFDWDCELCMMSLLQSTLDIYFIALKIFTNIIENKVQENFITNNVASVDTNMYNVFEDDVNDEKCNIHNDEAIKPNLGKNKNQETRATFVLLSSLEYFLPSAILEFCLCSKFDINVPDTYKKTNYLCENHKNESNGYIVQCFENAARFYEDKKKNDEIDTILLQILTMNKSIDETTTVKMKLVELLQQIVTVGQQHKPPTKENQKKKNQKYVDKKDQDNTTVIEADCLGTNEESPTGNMADVSSYKSDLAMSESESGSKSPLPPQELFPSNDEEIDCQLDNHTSNCKIERKSKIAYDLQDILTFSRGYYPDDDDFIGKLKEFLDILSIQSSADIHIIMRKENSLETNSSKKSRLNLQGSLEGSLERRLNEQEYNEENDGDNVCNEDNHIDIYQSPIDTNKANSKSTSTSKRSRETTGSSKKPRLNLQGSLGKKKFGFN